MKPISVLALTIVGTLAQVTLALAPGTQPVSLARPFGLGLAEGPATKGIGTGLSSSTDPIPLATRLLSQPPDQRTLPETATVRLDPGALVRQTEADARLGLIGTDSPFGHTLGYNTSATPTVADYAALPLDRLKADHASTDNPAMREMLAAVISLQTAGVPSTDIVAQLSDRQGFLRDANLPTTLGLEPGWLFASAGNATSPSAVRGSRAHVQGAHLAWMEFFQIVEATSSEASTSEARGAGPAADASQVLSLAYTLEKSPLLLLGFEQLYGSRDAVAEDKSFAVNLGAAQVAALTATPEPATWMTLGVCTAMGLWWRRRTVTAPREVVVT